MPAIPAPGINSPGVVNRPARLDARTSPIDRHPSSHGDDEPISDTIAAFAPDIAWPVRPRTAAGRDKRRRPVAAKTRRGPRGLDGDCLSELGLGVKCLLVCACGWGCLGEG